MVDLRGTSLPEFGPTEYPVSEPCFLFVLDITDTRGSCELVFSSGIQLHQLNAILLDIQNKEFLRNSH